MPSEAAVTTPSQPAAAAGPAYSHQQILRVITGIMLCILLAALDQTVVIPAVPAIAAQLGAFGHLSWIVSAYLLTSTAATPIYGKLSDLYGRRALLLPALALFIAASVLCALAQSLPQLIAFRALQGVGGAGLMAMAQAAIADVVSPRERGRYQGYMAAMWGVASVGGPVVGGWFTDHLSWTFVFWINVPLGLAAMWLCNRALKLLPVKRTGGRIDYIGALLLMAAVTAFLLVLSWGGTEYPWLSPQILGLLVLAAALFTLLTWHEGRVADAILPPRMFRDAVFTRGVMLAFLSSVGLLGTTFLLPLFFQLVRGADAASSGFLVVPFLLFSVIGAFSGGQLARRLGRTKAIVVAGFSAASFGFAALTLVGPATPLAAVLIAMAVVGVGIGVCMPNVLVMVQNAADRRDVGTATGALLFLRSMGGAFGSTLVGALLTGTFAASMAAAGFAGVTDLSALQPGGALAGIGAAGHAAGLAALTRGFHLAFGATLALFLVAAGIAAGLRDIPLRTVSSSAPEEQPAALGH
jgi:EmrB/QacA subfamily drug resistance transporter